jgi:Arm DNA-binding domain
MGTVRVELRKETKDKNDLCQLRLVYSIERKRQYIKTKLKARPEYWDKKKRQYLYLKKADAKK